MEHDVILKTYLSDNERYADLINGLGFNGTQVIDAKKLIELDTQSGIFMTDTLVKRSKTHVNRRIKRKIKYRDLIRKAAFGVNFAVIGVENQEEVHYLMPLRTMSYDAFEYEKQALEIKRQVRARKELSNAEFLSGFGKEDRLRPCITIVLFYGDEWDGSKDLYGLLDFSNIPEKLKKMVNNYSINLYEIKKLEDTSVFKTDLKQVFDFIRCSGDKEKLKELVEKDPVYKEMNEDAFDVATSYANADELLAMKKYHIKKRNCEKYEPNLKY